MNIDVDAYEGVVTLHGTVANQESARKAVTLAQSVKGVKRVESKLNIVP